MAIHSSILAWETPWTEEPGITGLSRGGYSPEGVAKSQTLLSVNTMHACIKYY